MDATFFSISRFLYNFLLIDATDRSKISSDQKRLFFAVSLYPLSFFENAPFNTQFLYIPFRIFNCKQIAKIDQIYILDSQRLVDLFCSANESSATTMLAFWSVLKGLYTLFQVNFHVEEVCPIHIGTL